MCKSNQKDVFDFKIYVCTCITAEIISNLNLGLEHSHRKTNCSNMLQ